MNFIARKEKTLAGLKKYLQKVFYFSSEGNKQLYESILADEIEVTGHSATYLTEMHLMESLTSKNRDAAHWIEDLYYIDPDGKRTSSIRHTMNSIFSAYSAGVDLKAAYPNGKPFVEYAMQMNLRTKNKKKDPFDHGSYYYLWDKIDSLCSYLKRFENATIIENREDEEVDAAIKKDITTLEYILSQKKESDDMSQTFEELYQIILGNWNNKGLDNWTYTYRLLSCMASMQTWEDNAETRTELCKTIRSFAASL